MVGGTEGDAKGTSAPRRAAPAFDGFPTAGAHACTRLLRQATRIRGRTERGRGSGAGTRLCGAPPLPVPPMPSVLGSGGEPSPKRGSQRSPPTVEGQARLYPPPFHPLPCYFSVLAGPNW